jgi:hypothetical protein
MQPCQQEEKTRQLDPDGEQNGSHFSLTLSLQFPVRIFGVALTSLLLEKRMLVEYSIAIVGGGCQRCRSWNFSTRTQSAKNPIRLGRFSVV